MWVQSATLTRMAEFNFGLALSSKHRCSSVGVAEERTELATCKLYSVWKQVKPPEDLLVLLKFYTPLIHFESGTAAKCFSPMACYSAGQKPHIIQCDQAPPVLSVVSLTLFMKQMSPKSRREESISRVITACEVQWISWNSSCGEVIVPVWLTQ